MNAERAAALPAARPCPFCGATAIRIQVLPGSLTSDQPGTAIVSCPGCLTVGPIKHRQSIEQATAAWNSRHGDDSSSDASGTGADECVFLLNL